MNKKCILLVRVSTQIQDLDQQRTVVFNAAKSEGYSEENIIIIEDKESAVKLSETERNGLNKMKEYIENDSSIDKVMCYELSRVSRQAKILYSIRDYLASKGVNLVVLNPSFRTLKDDGTLDPNSNIFFGLFSSLAENESFLSKRRQIRGKLKKMSEGKYVGATLPFGYTINNPKDKLIVINPNEADVVRRIFELYSTGNYSIGSLVKEVGLNRNKVGFILQNCSYCGRSGKDRSWGKTVTDFPLPQIINEDLFDKCAEVRNDNPNKPKKVWSNIYYCKGLIKCLECGWNYITKKNTNSYHCPNHAKHIPVNLFDSFAFELAKRSRKEKLKKGYMYDEELKKLQDSYSDYLNKKARAEQDVENLNKKLERLSMLFLNENIGQDLFDKKSKELKSELVKAKKEVERITNTVSEVSKRIDNVNQEKAESPLDLDNMTDDVERMNLVHEEIYSIVIMEKAKRSHKVKVGVSYNTIFSDLDLEIDDTRIEFYELDTKNGKIIDNSGNEFEYIYYNRYSRTDRTKEQHREAIKKYRATHKEKIAAYAREYRARKKALGGSK